jgi:hypothetical protein
MDAYFLKDAKTAQSKLDSDLDNYFAAKDKTKTVAADAPAGGAFFVLSNLLTSALPVWISE